MRNNKKVIDNIFRSIAAMSFGMAIYNTSHNVKYRSVLRRLDAECDRNVKLQNEIDLLMQHQKETIKNTRE